MTSLSKERRGYLSLSNSQLELNTYTMRTDIKIVLLLVDPSLEQPSADNSRVKSLSQAQAYINSCITKSELVKYKITPIGSNLIFEIIKTK